MFQTMPWSMEIPLNSRDGCVIAVINLTKTIIAVNVEKPSKLPNTPTLFDKSAIPLKAGRFPAKTLHKSTDFLTRKAEIADNKYT